MMSEDRDPDYAAMNSPPLGPLPLVLVVYFFADAIAATMVHGNQGSDITGIFVACVFASQAMLLMLWVGLGSTPLVPRCLLALAWCLWVVLLGVPQPREWKLEIFAGASLFLLAGAAPYGLLKVLGFRIVWRDSILHRLSKPESSAFRRPANVHLNALPVEAVDQRPADRFRSNRPGVQFSIVQILGWTLLVGVMGTLARLSGMQLQETPPLAVAVSVFAALGLTTLWAVLGGERVGWRLLAPFGVVALITVTFAYLFGNSIFGSAFIRYILWTLSLTTTTVAAVLGLFRGAGYRVRRQARVMDGARARATTSVQAGAPSPWDE